MHPFTYIDHAHVTAGALVAALGLLGLVVGLFRRLLRVAALAVAVLVAGVVVVGVALSGTHCVPGSQQRVCLAVHR